MASKKLNIRVQTKGAKKASQDLKGVDSRLSSLGKNALKAGAAFFAARGIINAFKSVVGAAAEQELAEKKLEAVLKSTSHAAGLQANELKKLAASLQQTTMFGDETIIGAQSLMLTFTKIGKDIFPAAIETVLNMSTAMGTDLQSSVIQLGKALNAPVEGISALSRVGVQLTEDQKNQIRSFVEMGEVAEAQKVILGELETQFGGMAKAAGETMAGAMAQAKNAMGDTAEVIGSLLAPVIVEISEAISELAKAIDVNKIKGYATALGLVAGAFVAVKIATLGWITSLRLLRLAMVKTGFGIAVIAIGEIAAAIYDELDPALDLAEGGFKDLAKGIDIVNKSTEQLTLTKQIAAASNEFAVLRDAMRDAWLSGNVKEEVRKIAKAIGVATKNTQGEWIHTKILSQAIGEEIKLRMTKLNLLRGESEALMIATPVVDLYATSIAGLNEKMQKLNFEVKHTTEDGLQKLMFALDDDAKFAVRSMQNLGTAMSQAAIHGQKMGDVVASALKSIAAEIAAQAALFALLNLFFPGATVAAGISGKAGFLKMLIGHSGGLVTNQGIQKFAGGGTVMGGDTVPAFLQSGEFVLSRNAVQSIGIDTAQRINQGGGAGITVNIMGGVVDDSYIRNDLIPAINKATNMGNGLA